MSFFFWLLYKATLGVLKVLWKENVLASRHDAQLWHEELVIDHLWTMGETVEAMLVNHRIFSRLVFAFLLPGLYVLHIYANILSTCFSG